MSYSVSAPVENTYTGIANPNVVLTGVPAGANILVYFDWGTGAGDTLVSISDGASYTQLGSTVVSGSAVDGVLYTLVGASAGSHTITATLSNTGGGYLAAWYVTGAGNSDGAVGADINFPGTGANAAATPSITTTTNGDIIFGVFHTVSGTGTYTAGTSPNVFSSVGIVTAGAFAEFFTQTTAGSVLANSTLSSNSDLIGFIAAFSPATASNSASIAWVS